MADDNGTALYASEERFRTLFEHAPFGVFLFDRERRTTASNAQLARILSFDPKAENAIELLGRRAEKLLPAIDATLDGEQASVTGSYQAESCAELVHFSLRLSPLRDADGAVIGGMGILEDVSDRVSLRKSEARFRALIEHAPDAIAVVRDGRFIYVNPALVGYLGYRNSAELEGKVAAEHIHLEDRGVLGERAAAREKRVMLEPHEYRFVRADGATLTAEVVSMLIDYDGGPAVLALGRDLTRRKLVEAHLLQSDRMASVGTLAAGVAHEINNPLAYVKANLDVVATRSIPQLACRVRALEEDAESPSFELSGRLQEIASMLELAREGAERMRFIVQDLKIFSRGADDTTSPVDVADANESRLGQVFLNLLANAAQAIPDGHAMDNEIRVRTFVDVFDRVCIAVSDTGAGIPADTVARIFDPFFTTKAVGVGTGLGLWICQGIVAAMGGEIRMASTKGRGTTIIVSLPSRFARALKTV